MPLLRLSSSMRPAEVVAIRERLDLSQAELAKLVEAKERTVRAWEAGTRRVPSKVKRWLAWRLAVARRERAFEESGLEHCKWLLDWMAGLHGRSSGVSPLWIGNTIKDHERKCPTCIAKREWEAMQPPLPLEPASWWQRPWLWLFDAVEYVLSPFPGWLRPSVLSALLFPLMTLLYALPELTTPPISPTALESTIRILPWSVLAGAAWGQLSRFFWLPGRLFD